MPKAGPHGGLRPRLIFFSVMAENIVMITIVALPFGASG
jgi:hypothetical protein